jgi:DNA-binding GntR family transcriptional regulator
MKSKETGPSRATTARSSGEKPVSLNEQAYREIKRLILRLKLKPGDYLNEAKLSDTLKVGRTPVNRAVHRLSFEGLVQILPRKGILVQPLSFDEVADLIDVRRLNEPYCARCAAERIDAEELDALTGILRQATQAVGRRDIDRVVDLDRSFHQILSRASRNKVLHEMLMQLHDRSQRFWTVSLSDVRHLEEIVPEHTAIIEALRKRDAAGAANAMEAHIESFSATMKRALR